MSEMYLCMCGAEDEHAIYYPCSRFFEDIRKLSKIDGCNEKYDSYTAYLYLLALSDENNDLDIYCEKLTTIFNLTFDELKKELKELEKQKMVRIKYINKNDVSLKIYDDITTSESEKDKPKYTAWGELLE